MIRRRKLYEDNMSNKNAKQFIADYVKKVNTAVY